MKKIKWIIMTTAVSFSIISAFSFRPHPMQSGLYHAVGGGYAPVNGVLGVGWVCETSTNVCTYTKSGQTYTPYQTGATYVSLGAATPAPEPKPEPKKKEQ